MKCWLTRNEPDTVLSRISAIGFSNEPTLKHLAHEYIKTNRNEIFTEYCKRTHYDYNQNERRQVISSILERIFNVIIEPIPISILELFIRCKTEDPNFLKENDEGFELLKKVYRGRNIDLENTKKVFIKAFETENEEEILATAV